MNNTNTVISDCVFGCIAVGCPGLQPMELSTLGKVWEKKIHKIILENLRFDYSNLFPL